MDRQYESISNNAALFAWLLGSPETNLTHLLKLQTHMLILYAILYIGSYDPSTIALLLFYFIIIIFWLHWVFVAACRLSLVVASGGYSSLLHAGFSLRWLPLLQSTSSRRAGFSSCGLRALERRLGSCGTWA